MLLVLSPREEDQELTLKTGLYRSTCSAQVTSPGVQNSSRHSSKSHKSGGDLIRASLITELIIISVY